METNTFAEKNVYLPQNAEARAIEILVQTTTEQKEKFAKPAFVKVKNGFETVWRVFWALWALPTIRIQKAPGAYVTHAEEYQNLQNQVSLQNIRPY